MGVECDIIIDNSAGRIIQCGETIHGTLIVRSESSFVAKGIYVKLRGKGRVSYKRYWNDYVGHEQYFSPDEYISSKELQLSAGENEFKFQLSIPEHFPPTFAFAPNMGHIYYNVAAYLDNEDSQKKIGKLRVTVQGKLDLRSDPAYRMPVSVREEKGFFFSRHGLELILSIPQTGFAIGQNIPFSILVRNESTVDCDDSKIYLVQYVNYTNSKGVVSPITTENVVREKQLSYILKHSTKMIDAVLDIPKDVCITTHDRSKIISVYYKLRFVAIVDGPHFNGQVECPVTIGSIPVDEENEKRKF